MERNENELKELYIEVIKELCYEFSLEEIEQIYKFIDWKWHKSPIVAEKMNAIIEENRRTGALD